MTTPVTLPLWLLLLILAFAVVTFASHFLFPSVRWFLRRRAERVVARLNTRLKRPIEPFKLARRFDTIQRLTYDAQVLQAVSETARATGTREDVVLEEVGRYAREIVPRFSATLYFGLATRVARWLAQRLYRVRILREDEAPLPHEATVVYVMNHRSNMDYVLVTYLAAGSSALSYAMGEWARAWPLGPLLRAMGGYFIRRQSRSALYRKVLARYVGIATEGGLTQAVFPEGGLSLDGAVAEPKLGIISYIVAAAGAREIVFVPVAINYDRVLEDRMLIRAGQRGERRFRVGAGTAAGYLVKLIRRRFDDPGYRFGEAAVVFGAPVPLSEIPGTDGAPDPQAVAADLMARIARAMPVLPVPLVAEALIAAGGTMARPDMLDAVRARVAGLGAAHVIPEAGGLDTAVDEALRGLELRRVIRRTPQGAEVLEPDVLAYYARSIAHLGQPSGANPARSVAT